MNDIETISIANKVSSCLGKVSDATVSSMIYQVLLLTNESVSRVILLSLLQNIPKRCQFSQFPTIISHFSYALKSNAVTDELSFSIEFV